jgi:hypothetical protein
MLIKCDAEELTSIKAGFEPFRNCGCRILLANPLPVNVLEIRKAAHGQK